MTSKLFDISWLFSSIFKFTLNHEPRTTDTQWRYKSKQPEMFEPNIPNNYALDHTLKKCGVNLEYDLLLQAISLPSPCKGVHRGTSRPWITLQIWTRPSGNRHFISLTLETNKHPYQASVLCVLNDNLNKRLIPYPCSHFYCDIKFGDILYSKEKRPGSPFLFWI